MSNKLLCLFFIFAVVVSNAEEYHVAFYSDFEPISYSADKDPASKKFHEPRGYEIDLLKAIESIKGSDMNFTFHGVKVWDNLWLTPHTTPEIDIAIGGITREEKRTFNEQEQKVVAMTHKTVSFEQSLLIHSKDKDKVRSHKDLNISYVIGAVMGTTGEYRFLAQAGLIKDIDSGLLVNGISVILPDREVVTSDGTLSIHDPKLERRTMIIPASRSLPQVKYYLAEDSMIPALQKGSIDGVARGYIGNKLVADRSDGKLVVRAIYSLECPKQFSTICAKKEEAVMFVKEGNQQLLEKLNYYIDLMTDNGKIDYSDWEKDHDLFFKRAKIYHTR